jgi:transcriptional regulator with XRE-family HTH domain
MRDEKDCVMTRIIKASKGARSKEPDPRAVERGKIIATQRVAKGMSQEDLARRLGIKQASVANIEKGHTRQSRYLPAIAELLELDPDIFRATGLYMPIAKTVDNKDSSRYSHDFPVYFMKRRDSGEETVLSAEPIEYVERPTPVMTVKDSFGICIDGDENYPAYKPGDMVFVHPHQPSISGVDVILRPTDRSDLRVHVGELKEETATERQISLYNRDRFLRLKKADWNRCDRIVGKYNRR